MEYFWPPPLLPSALKSNSCCLSCKRIDKSICFCCNYFIRLFQRNGWGDDLFLIPISYLGACHMTDRKNKLGSPIGRNEPLITTQHEVWGEATWGGHESWYFELPGDVHWKPVESGKSRPRFRKRPQREQQPSSRLMVNLTCVAGYKVEVAEKLLLAVALATARLVPGPRKHRRGYMQATSIPSMRLEMACRPCGKGLIYNGTWWWCYTLTSVISRLQQPKCTCYEGVL